MLVSHGFAGILPRKRAISVGHALWPCQERLHSRQWQPPDATAAASSPCPALAALEGADAVTWLERLTLGGSVRVMWCQVTDGAACNEISSNDG